MVVAIATEGDEDIRRMPTTSSTSRRCATRFSAITASVPLQLFARAIAVARAAATWTSRATWRNR